LAWIREIRGFLQPNFLTTELTEEKQRAQRFFSYHEGHEEKNLCKSVKSVEKNLCLKFPD